MVITKTIIFGAFGIAFFIALITTPLAIKVAPKIGAMDVPKNKRRIHNNTMPRFYSDRKSVV